MLGYGRCVASPARRISGRVLAGGSLQPGVVHLADDGSIEAVEPHSGAPADRIVAPGFVDLQVNGVDDVDVADADGRDWDVLAARLAEAGVTAWLPTLITRPLAAYDAPLGRIAAAVAGAADRRPAVLGAHLEGPFLGGAPGAHPRSSIADIELEWLRALPATVRLVTLAPEQAAVVEAIRLLAGRGVVVSLGHGRPTTEQALAACEAGASMVTHLFNGMGGLHHREPGLAGVALADDRLVVGLIADGVHVHPLVLRTVFRAKRSDRVALVSDAVAWRSRRQQRVGVAVVDGAPRLTDGTIAGSVLTMDRAVRTVVDAGVPVFDALTAASTTPARVLQDARRGRLSPGARGDLTVLDGDSLEVCETVVGGRSIWTR